MQPTGRFYLKSFDGDGNKIDTNEAQILETSMTELSDFKYFTVHSSKYKNGEIGNYEITHDFGLKVQNGDKLIFKLPPELSVAGPIQCHGSNFDIDCAIMRMNGTITIIA